MASLGTVAHHADNANNRAATNHLIPGDANSHTMQVSRSFRLPSRRGRGLAVLIRPGHGSLGAAPTAGGRPRFLAEASSGADLAAHVQKKLKPGAATPGFGVLSTKKDNHR